MISLNHETRDGCTQIYNFTQEFLEDMYVFPDKYDSGKSPLKYLVYSLDGRIKDGAILDENELNWIIPSDKLDMEKHLPRLGLFGFYYIEKDGCKIIKNDKYPLLLKYWYKLYKLGPKGSAVRLRNIQASDFRLFSKSKKKTFNDLLYSLSDRDRMCFNELYNYTIQKGAKKETGQYRYNYRNEHVILFDPKPCVVISFKTKSGNSLESFIAEVNKQPDRTKIISYIENKAECCVPCGHPLCKGSNEVFICFPCDNKNNIRGGTKKFDEITVRLGCRYDIVRGNKSSQTYTNDDVVMLKRLIDIRLAQIGNS